MAAQDDAAQYDAALWRRVLADSGVTDPATGEPFTEAMLAGLAGGIGFMVATFSYASVTTATVVLRAHPEPYTERLLDRCGAPIERLQTGGARTAQRSLDAAQEAGRAVVVRVTRGALPWVEPAGLADQDSLDVAVLGRQAAGYVIMADDAGPHHALPEQLAAARAARRADRHWAAWVAAPGTAATPQDLADRVREAVAETTGRLLGTLPLDGIPAGWLPKFGVAGLRTWAALLRDDRTQKGWPALFAESERLRGGLQMLRDQLAGPRWGGAGGLRGLYADFLAEASHLPGLEPLGGAAGGYRDLAPHWDALAEAVDPAIDVAERTEYFAALADRVADLADREESAARTLAAALAENAADNTGETPGASGAR